MNNHNFTGTVIKLKSSTNDPGELKGKLLLLSECNNGKEADYYWISLEGLVLKYCCNNLSTNDFVTVYVAIKSKKFTKNKKKTKYRVVLEGKFVTKHKLK